MEKVDPLANSSDLQGKTVILVVDDEKIVCLTVCARPKRAGYMSVSVGSVDEAVQMLKAHPHTFSAIISDIMLGKMDGFALSASATEASTRRYTMSNWVNTRKRSKT